MRLLRHFITYTARTLSDRSNAKEIWRTSVIDCAFEFPFLLQGILAIAALHIASQDSSQGERLSIVAASKQNMALSDFRGQLENITEENCHALFAFSFLAGYYIPASAGTIINPSARFLQNNFYSAIVDWIRLYRGTMSIYQCHREWISSGLLKNLFPEQDFTSNTRPRLAHGTKVPNNHYMRRLEKFKQRYNLTVDVDDDDQGVEEERRINAEAFIALMDGLQYIQDEEDVDTFHHRQVHGLSNGDENAIGQDKYDPVRIHSTDKKTHGVSLSLAWLFKIPPGFVELLERRDPISMVIFAHFSIIMRNGPQFWWNEFIPAKIVKAVAAVLESRYQEWIEWPIREVISPDSLTRLATPS